MLSDAIPFRAALFDLDGTLLDSLDVWHRVDAAFFRARGIAYDQEEYSRAVQGMSFRGSAEYTRRRYGLSESCDEVIAEWMRMTAEEYAARVPMKPGALDYLRLLKRAGVKLAVATSNKPELFRPALERGGALELFDAVCTSAEVGDVNKRGGELYRLAARRLGVDPAACAVFEDALDGVAGAKAAGMAAYAVLDPLTAPYHAELRAMADGAVEAFDQMCRHHPFPDNARRCVIFTAHCEGDVRKAYAPLPGDYVLCADGGWELARSMGVAPDCVIGDFDSSGEPGDLPTVRVPVEKDDTDTMLCLKRGLAMGFEDFLIVGGFGGRLDHTLANLQALHYAAARHAQARMRDGATWAAAVRNGALRVPADVLGPGRVKLSVFALGDRCSGVTLRGTKYALEDGTLANTFPLGVSNEFAGEEAQIEVRDGALLVVACRE